MVAICRNDEKLGTTIHIRSILPGKRDSPDLILSHNPAYPDLSLKILHLLQTATVISLRDVKCKIKYKEFLKAEQVNFQKSWLYYVWHPILCSILLGFCS